MNTTALRSPCRRRRSTAAGMASRLGSCASMRPARTRRTPSPRTSKSAAPTPACRRTSSRWPSCLIDSPNPTTTGNRSSPCACSAAFIRRQRPGPIPRRARPRIPRPRATPPSPQERTPQESPTMPLDSPQMTLLDVLARRLETDPDGPYLDFEGIQVTARQIDEDADRLAHALADLGVVRGDRVATLLENRPEQVVSFFATMKLGAIHQPVNTAYRGEFLRHQLADSGVKVVIVQGDLASRVQLVAGAGTPELESVIVLGEPDEPITVKPQYDWASLLADSSSDPLPDPKLGPSDLACFVYTSCTTGPSKGCMLPHNYLVTLADQIARAFGRRHDDVVLTPLPLFHLSALAVGVIGTLIVGGRASIGHRFSVSRFWPEVKRTGATMISMLGSLANLIANAKDHPDQVGHTLRVCVAVPMPPDTDKAWRERFGCATLSGGYGLTEASFIAMQVPHEPSKPGSPDRKSVV